MAINMSGQDAQSLDIMDDDELESMLVRRIATPKRTLGHRPRAGV